MRPASSAADTDDASSSRTSAIRARPVSWDPTAKRAASSQSSSAHASTSNNDAAGAREMEATRKQQLAPAGVVTAPRRKRSKRKTRTADVRRDEIGLLRKESKFLEAQIEFLQHRAGVHDQQRVDTQVAENALFREWLRSQQHLLAGLKSAVTTDTSDQVVSPLSTPIRLGSDLTERREHLLAIKPQKLSEARAFLEKRTQFLDPTKLLTETTQFQSVQGEMCASKLDVIPLYSATSVKQVYDALLHHVLNVEMSTAEVNGDIIVREEAETGDESVSQNRFLFLKKQFGVDVETNNAIFCEFSPLESPSAMDSDSSGEGLVAVDVVDDDALYPYRPSERLRDDIRVVIFVKSHRLPSSSEHVVVLTKWVQAKLHASAEINLPADALFDLRRHLDRVSDAVLELVRARFRSAPVTSAALASETL